MLTWCEWNKNRGQWTTANRKQRQELYRNYKLNYEAPQINQGWVSNYAEKYNMNYITDLATPNSLANVPCVPCPPSPKVKCGYKNQEGSNPMNYASATVTAAPTDTQVQRKYLEGRLYEVYQTLRQPLEATFGLVDDDAPTTPKDLAQRLADGKFTIRGLDEKDTNDYRYYGFRDLIQWRDPARKADKDGFAAARKDLKAKRQDVLDTIKIGEPAEALKALKDLESWTPTGAAN